MTDLLSWMMSCIKDYQSLVTKISQHLEELRVAMETQGITIDTNNLVELLNKFINQIGVSMPVKMMDGLDVNALSIVGQLPIKGKKFWSVQSALVAMSPIDIDSLDAIPTMYVQNPDTVAPQIF